MTELQHITIHVRTSLNSRP